MNELSTLEQVSLEKLERTIEKGLASFYEVGSALLTIRNSRLYRGTYGTFEAYCLDRWGMARRTAYQYIDSVKTIDNVRNCAQIEIMPENEAQARPLAALPREQQPEAWQRAVATAPEGKVTAAHVASVVKGMTEPEDREVKAAPEDSRNLSDAKNIWHTCSAEDKRKFIRWIWEYFGKYVVELFLLRIKRLGPINTDDESDTLFHLKRWWARATKKDKKNLFSWLREDR